MAPLLEPVKYGSVTGMLLPWRSLAPNNSALEAAVQQALSYCNLSNNEPLRSPADQRCKTMVLTMRQSNLRVPVRLRSYNSRTDPDDGVSAECTILQAAVATMALPTKYNSIQIAKSLSPYISAGLGYANPAKEALDEALRIWQLPAIHCVLSLGGGRSSIPHLKQDVRNHVFSVLTVVGILATIVSDSTRVHTELYRDASHLNIKYFRFEVRDRLEKISMDEWVKIKDVCDAAEEYIKEVETSSNLVLCADFLRQR